jgi:hypothetical protein
VVASWKGSLTGKMALFENTKVKDTATKTTRNCHDRSPTLTLLRAYSQGT